MSISLATLKKHKTAILASIAINIGSILFGFDTGIAGGVIALASFKKEFNLEEKVNYTNASSNIVAILNLGAFIGALIPPFTTEFVGRQPLLGFAGLLFMLGGILQTAASGPTLGMIYGGRVVSGLGVGIISNVAPIFVAECAPKELRGVLVTQSLPTRLTCPGGRLDYSRFQELIVIDVAIRDVSCQWWHVSIRRSASSLVVHNGQSSDI